MNRRYSDRLVRVPVVLVTVALVRVVHVPRLVGVMAVCVALVFVMIVLVGVVLVTVTLVDVVHVPRLVGVVLVGITLVDVVDSSYRHLATSSVCENLHNPSTGKRIVKSLPK